MNFLVLGSGMISRPMIRYLLNQPDYRVTTATLSLDRAKQIINGHERGMAIYHDVTNLPETEKLVMAADIVVSLVPYQFHIDVANMCIKHRKHMVTTSYVRENMRALDEKAKEAGILLLNECGLDPGIDHMSAMRMIHDAHSKGGKVISFHSVCGALPAPEANNNPFGYKFSWSPQGVLIASRQSARWLEHGQEIKVNGPDLFANYHIHDVPKVGTFEDYPNRDSLPYRDAYGLQDAHTVYRGTLRLMGWCETLKTIADIGWLDESRLRDKTCKTYGDLTRYLLHAENEADAVTAVSKHTGLKPAASAMKRIEWLGLLSKDPLPENMESPIDYLHELTLRRLPLQEGDRDMVVMHHEFTIQYEDRTEERTSTLVDYGVSHDDTAVARTVTYPAAIATKMLAEGKLAMTGVRIPIYPEIYNPILDELEMDYGITFIERTLPKKPK